MSALPHLSQRAARRVSHRRERHRSSTRVGKESLAAVAHDARNLAAALELCCDLLAKPGVLADEHRSLASELRGVAAASTGLVTQLAGMHGLVEVLEPRAARICDLAEAVERLERPLAALVGADIRLEMECLACFGQVRLSREALTRILINLARNAAEAMPHGGRIRITVQQGDGGSFLDGMRAARTVLLCVQDSGPGISPAMRERLFDKGFTTKSNGKRGLGLSIVRHLVEAAEGQVRATGAPGGGARFEVELPLIPQPVASGRFVADFEERAILEC